LPEPHHPSGRKLLGITLIVLVIMMWAGLIILFAPAIGHWPILVQSLFYLVVGVVWVIPLRPLLRWIETGQR
jgi:hypothetical protein